MDDLFSHVFRMQLDTCYHVNVPDGYIHFYMPKPCHIKWLVDVYVLTDFAFRNTHIMCIHAACKMRDKRH